MIFRAVVFNKGLNGQALPENIGDCFRWGGK
jgi:hypothetical protein